jgi:DNA-binding transcriptional LysR family regulator
MELRHLRYFVAVAEAKEPLVVVLPSDHPLTSNDAIRVHDIAVSEKTH